jgi:hypothetical protein
MLELLTRCGRDIPEVMMMLIPEAWQNDALMPQVWWPQTRGRGGGVNGPDAQTSGIRLTPEAWQDDALMPQVRWR